MTGRSSHSPILLLFGQCPAPRLASTFECCVHSQLLTATRSVSVRMSTSIRARADLNQFPFAAHLVSWKRPFPTEPWHLMAAHGLIRVSSSACVRLQNAQTVVLPVHQFACVPFRSCKHALHIVVRNQSAMDMFKFLRLARARVPWRVLFFPASCLVIRVFGACRTKNVPLRHRPTP